MQEDYDPVTLEEKSIKSFNNIEYMFYKSIDLIESIKQLQESLLYRRKVTGRFKNMVINLYQYYLVLQYQFNSYLEKEKDAKFTAKDYQKCYLMDQKQFQRAIDMALYILNWAQAEGHLNTTMEEARGGSATERGYMRRRR